jgi:glycosyltransferase involved in cell wall biosynthesis
MGIQTALDEVRGAHRLVGAMRAAEDLAFEASRSNGARTIRVLTSAIAGSDQLTAIAATHALGRVVDEQADLALTRLLSSDRRFLREHAAQVLGERLPRVDAMGRLIAMVAEGGFGGMLAERTLERWSQVVPDHLLVGLEGALVGIRKTGPRTRLVDTLGLVRRHSATRPLVAIVKDQAEPRPVRAAAIAALGQRPDDAEVASLLAAFAERGGHLGDVARLALLDLAAPAARVETDGLTVAQLFLHADIDAGLTRAGSGDNGGIATLLVRLGNALLSPDADTRVDRVITMSRGSAEDALASAEEIRAGERGHVYGRVPLLTDPVGSADAWPLRVVARRGIRRILRAAGHVDVLHLRMADVGSLAAADVARELDIPVTFTVAPDPHAVIDSLDAAGALTRATFGQADETDHFWFRARLVERLAADASRSVLFPRPDLERDMRELVGIDLTAHPERHSIVPEGIDLDVVDRSVLESADHAAGLPPTPPLAGLEALLETLPAERRGLPLLVSVGRFHRVKGTATIVEAWADGPLADAANLLLIGGDLVDPSADERDQLDRIDAIVPPDQRAAAGLLLAGHRPNDDVARWVAAVRFGVPGLAAPRGVYVCGSLKEEFGIAILEAMAAGLVVVAPDGGGPATYVERGVTGFLAATWDVVALRAAMVDALAAAGAESGDERAARSRATVEASFTIGAMARTLRDVYTGVREEELAAEAWLGA